MEAVTDWGCFSCGGPTLLPPLVAQKGLKRLLRDWKQACSELSAARRLRLASERRADMKVARLEREIVRWCWAHVFLNGRGLDSPKTARPHIASRRT